MAASMRNRPTSGCGLHVRGKCGTTTLPAVLLLSPVLLEDASVSRYLPGIASSLRVLCAVFPPTPGPSRQHAWRVPTTSPKL